MITATINGQTITVPEGTTIYDAALDQLGIQIPTLCHTRGLNPVAVCRVCTVEVEKQRVLQAACIRPIENGMVIQTDSPRAVAARKTLVKLLMADHDAPCVRQQQSHDCELEVLAERFGLGAVPESPDGPQRTLAGMPRRVRETARPTTTEAGGLALPPSPYRDDSSPIIAVDHSACILCDRCVRACDDVRHNDVIGRWGKGYGAGIGFDMNLPMGRSSCVSCGECMISCPTGALTNKGFSTVQLAGVPTADEFDPAELVKLPVFEGISPAFLRRQKGAVVRRRYKKGDIICREGEFGTTAFYLLKGQVEVSITAPMAHLQNEQAHRGGLVNRMASLLRRGRRLDDESGRPRQTIPIDGPIDLDLDHPVDQMGPGELFGEMTCLNFYPRSATVRALEDCELLEMLRTVLEVFRKSRKFAAQLERNYRERSLKSHLRSTPLLAELSDEFIDYLRARVVLTRCAPGDVIFRQGDPADSFFLVRLGFVKVTQSHPGGELVRAYLGRGSYLGEIGLLEQAGLRTATCTALDHVELVRVSADDFKLMLERFPAVRAALSQVAQERVAADRAQVERLRTIPLTDFLNQGLYEAQSLLLIDLERCTRCDECVKACASAHDGVTRLIRDGLRFDKYLVATSCRHCRDPLCMIGCPVGSIGRGPSLEVVIKDWCIGCGLCASQCPYGNINMHPVEVLVEDAAHPGRKKAVQRNKATSCDLCTDLPSKDPSCVYACPHHAAQRVDPKEFFKESLGTPLPIIKG
ncbi:MAG TPA: cyclic nucleotide-binding domain-containing protein [Phycisphaerae bacterium]|jgi:CRP-like cAMP-binding protein/Pyruvate/2-oxoacid:ferredoxin oxidoreductase delta subunit/sulfur carrier protein ThiS